MVSGTLLQLLGATYEAVLVPQLSLDFWNKVLYDFEDRYYLRCFYGKLFKTL